MVEETNRLARLVKERFEWAKLDQNSFVLEKETIDLVELFTRTEFELIFKGG
jgi:signal transduction histidine kinase